MLNTLRVLSFYTQEFSSFYNIRATSSFIYLSSEWMYLMRAVVQVFVTSLKHFRLAALTAPIPNANHTTVLMPVYARRSAEKHTAMGCQTLQRGRMSKLAFLIVRRLSPGELLIFTQKRQQGRSEGCIFVKPSVIWNQRVYDPLTSNMIPFLYRCLPGEKLHLPSKTSNCNGGTFYSFIALALSLLGEGGPGCDLNIINGSLAALGLDLSG